MSKIQKGIRTLIDDGPVEVIRKIKKLYRYKNQYDIWMGLPQNEPVPPTALNYNPLICACVQCQV